MMPKKLKISLIGAGGMRTPLLLEAVLQRGIVSELRLFDTSKERLGEILPIAQAALEGRGASTFLKVANKEEEAIKGVDAVIISIRPGVEQGRIFDEGIPLKYGILGQETIGPGGIFLACRTIPAVVRYARLVNKLSPNAWILNFTNPVGITTQALINAKIERAVGICDSSQSHKYVACDYLGLDFDEVKIKVCGLNHLSFCYSITHRKKEILFDLINDEQFLELYYPAYSPDWVKKLGVLPNEYPYYYLNKDSAVVKMKEEQLRSEQVLRFRADLRRLVGNFNYGLMSKSGLLNNYRTILGEREESYMSYAHPDKKRKRPLPPAEGYAGISLDFLEGVFFRKKDVVLSIANAKKLPRGLSPADVVEVSCNVTPKGIKLGGFGKLPNIAKGWILAQKKAERLVCEAVEKKSRSALWQAFAASPIVPKKREAKQAFEELFEAHKEFFEGWQ